MRPRDVGRAVIVRSSWGYWRGVLVLAAPNSVTCMVRPTERGNGWSKAPLELRKVIVDFDDTSSERAALRLVEGGRAS